MRYTPRLKLQIIRDIDSGAKKLEDFALSLEELQSWRGKSLNGLFALPEKRRAKRAGWYKNPIDTQTEST